MNEPSEYVRLARKVQETMDARGDYERWSEAETDLYNEACLVVSRAATDEVLKRHPLLFSDVAIGDIIVDGTRGLGPRFMPRGLAHDKE